jgi:ribosomal protein S18 acetylase RimI-like enzyme
MQVVFFMNEIEITHLTVADWQAYRELRLEALRESPQAFGSSFHESVSRPDSHWQYRLEEAARGEEGWLLFARSGQKLVGLIGAYHDKVASQQLGTQVAEVISVYVTPAARGRGISKLLMQSILDVLKESGIHTARLDVNPDQIPALRLYQGFGFTTIDIEQRLLGDGDYHEEYIMEKVLEDRSL